MVLINEELFDAKSQSTFSSADLSFSNEPTSVGIATKEDNGCKIFVVYANNERGRRDWEEEFYDHLEALEFAKTMWRGMTKACAKFDNRSRATSSIISLVEHSIAPHAGRNATQIAALTASSHRTKQTALTIGKRKTLKKKELSKSPRVLAAHKKKKTI